MENYYFSIIARSRFVLIAGLIMLTNSCKDFVEEDLSKEMVQMIIPTDNDTIQSNLVHFKWNELDGADKYRLQLVTPSFSNINTYVLDSLVEGTNFYYSLNPGQYEFMMRAENSAYESIFAGPFAFVVDSVSDLSNQTVPLVSPADGLYSNALDLTLTWQTIFAAEYYEIQIRAGNDFDNSGTILHTATNIYGSSYTTTNSTFFSEAEYSWGVRAINSSSQTSFSSRQINIDATPPNDVSLISPGDTDSNPDDTVVFKWTSGSDPGSVNSPISYELEIDTDAGLSNPILYSSTQDSLLLILSTGTYFWRVNATDEAGNTSVNPSSIYSVIIP